MGTPTRLVVDTGGGRRVLDLELDHHGDVRHAVCDMGPVTFVPSEIPLNAASAFDLDVECDAEVVTADAAGMGNPHLVIFVDDPATIDLARQGARLERDVRFPNRVNVEFVAVTAPDEITMRVWERGVGETQSCGTGACAVGAVAHRRGLVGPAVTVHVLGGDLRVEVGDTIRLGGPVHHVFDVEVDPESLREQGRLA
jgi:diaminopimelate epimerase